MAARIGSGEAARAADNGAAIGPLQPYDGGYRSAAGKFCMEYLNAHWFTNLDDAVRKCKAWRRDHNEVRPHSLIGNIPPKELVNRLAANDPR